MHSFVCASSVRQGAGRALTSSLSIGSITLLMSTDPDER